MMPELPTVALTDVLKPGLIDMVNHPPHYKHPCGVETIVMSEHAGFAIGNAIKYVLRHDKKGTPLLDLQKAEFYLKRYLAMSVKTPIWLSDEGRTYAKEALDEVIEWEEQRWWDGHPLPQFYDSIRAEFVPDALTAVGHLIKLNGGEPHVPA